MNYQKKRHKRFLSIFLMLTLLLSNSSYFSLSADASNNISSNDVLMNATSSFPSASYESEPDLPSTTSENDLSEETLSSNQLPSSENDTQTESVSDDISSDDTTSDNEELLMEETVTDTNSDNEAVDNTLPSVSSGVSSNDASDDASEEEELPETYTLIFDFNGGVDAEGNTSYQVTATDGDYISPYMQAAQDKNFFGPHRFLYKWDMYITETGEIFEKNGNDGYNETVKNQKRVRGNYTFKAIWSEDYAIYNINYMLDGGSFDETASDIQIPYTYTYADTINLPSPVRPGYLFGGFYTDASFSGSPISTITNGTFGDITLYAKWISATPTTVPNLTKIKNTSKGTVKINFKKMKKIDGYELLMSTSKSFNKNTNTIDVKSSASSVKVTNLPQGKTYYFKLRAYVLDSTGERCYSSYSNVLKQKINNGVKEYDATSSSANLKSCQVTQKTTLSVKFKVSKRLKSSDDSYYLVTLNPATNKYAKEIAKAPKTTTVTFNLPLRDKNGTNLVHGKYALAIKNENKYKIISASSFITNPEAAASYTASFPEGRTKKGMQGSTDPDLGLSHTFFNIDLNTILNGTIPYNYNGKTYYFNDPWGNIISECNKAGLTVTGQIMLSYDESTSYMILKSGRTPGKLYYAINAKEKKARETFEAATSFLAERYSKEDCHLDNWILGNEVNIHQTWYYAGNISREDFMKNYADTFRILYYSVKSHSENSRVYICMDHTWNDVKNDWGTRPFIDAFHEEIKSQQENIEWNLAFHAYPATLTKAATWNDSDTLAPNSNKASYISPKNLDILTKYVKKHFGSETRIILSEQGFTSSSGQDVQAAAIAYTYYKAEFNSMIDAVIFRSDVDHPVETAQNLYLGLKDLAGNKKEAYDVFKYMDTPEAENYTNKYLATIGISKWKDIAPKYTLKRFK